MSRTKPTRDWCPPAGMLILLITLAQVGAIGGCTTTTGTPREMSQSQSQQIRLNAENSTAVPIQMLLTMGTPTDSNSNRYIDTLPTVVYLFPEQSESRLPVWSRGVFRFELRADTGELLTAWEFSEQIANAARVSLAPGPGYSFYLRFAPGTDSAFVGSASLNGIFIHENGSQASSNGAATVRLGKH